MPFYYFWKNREPARVRRLQRKATQRITTGTVMYQPLEVSIHFPCTGTKREGFPCVQDFLFGREDLNYPHCEIAILRDAYNRKYCFRYCLKVLLEWTVAKSMHVLTKKSQ